MTYTTFNRKAFDATLEPMFFGENVNVARYDRQRYPIFEKLVEKQLSFFWRPEEVDLSNDRHDFQAMPAHEQHIFLSNLKYQTLLDSVQGRSPNLAFLPIVSLPELETWIETWAFSETIHSRSYTHIIRNVMNDPSQVFDDIINNHAIGERAVAITEYYDRLIGGIGRYYNNDPRQNTQSDLYELKKTLYLTLVAVNVLEAIRFYASFACSFAFAERTLMEGNAKIIKLIARDEALHLTGTQHMLQLMADGKDDPEMAAIARSCRPQAEAIFIQAAEQEKAWAHYLFKNGSMIGLNKDILCQYVEYITQQRMQAIGLNSPFTIKQNPLPWMNSWLISDNVQVAPQEAEISSYLVGQIDADMDQDDFSDFSL